MIEKYILIKPDSKYAVSNKGHIMNIRTGRILKTRINHNGYEYVQLSEKKEGKRNYFIHRLVAFAFINNPELKPYINHKDGNKLNNSVENLEWCTAKENDTHARVMKLKDQNKPIKAISILDPENIQIYESLSECSRCMCINKGTIHRALSGKRRATHGYHFEYI